MNTKHKHGRYLPRTILIARFTRRHGQRLEDVPAQTAGVPICVCPKPRLGIDCCRSCGAVEREV